MAGRQSGRLAVAEQQKVLDQEQRAKRLKKQLDNLDRDNFHEDPHAHLQWHKKIPKFDDEEIAGLKQPKAAKKEGGDGQLQAKRKKKTRSEHYKQRFRKNFFQLMDETTLRPDPEIANNGRVAWEMASVGPSLKPARSFCPPCGKFAIYKCVRCGTGYCSIACRDTHNDTRCMKWTV
ncbi:hypothetical protein L596_014537 [Steinernema carpocapsae]|uniref:HIT-type domain-containing protein n=1 Tax=Steinernema carpocapsae TaxID=34508 RepID=A0A4U5NC77_STECR|nr:hypothetical protein L596_014537 [Steinernema carpocapsae]